MWTKICGTTNLEDALLAADLGADALGFIFAPSRRQVTSAQARSIIEALPQGLETVGVFTAGSADSLSDVVRETGLTAVQLHMPLDKELLRALRARLGEKVKLLQVIGLEVNPDRAGEELQRFGAALEEALVQPGLFAVLIDAMQGARSGGPGVSGGLGVQIDWRAASEAVSRARASAKAFLGGLPPRVLLAGGLRAENVREAVNTLQPWGVDVVSGVEAAPGRKDPNKLRAFLQEAHSLPSREI